MREPKYTIFGCVGIVLAIPEEDRDGWGRGRREKREGKVRVGVKKRLLEIAEEV
jgi:hypothetical protein